LRRESSSGRVAGLRTGQKKEARSRKGKGRGEVKKKKNNLEGEKAPPAGVQEEKWRKEG